MKEINQVFRLCVKKGLFFNFSPHVSLISVYDLEMDFSVCAYYAGRLIDVRDVENKYYPLPELLELVKNYKPKQK